MPSADVSASRRLLPLPDRWRASWWKRRLTRRRQPIREPDSGSLGVASNAPGRVRPQTRAPPIQAGSLCYFAFALDISLEGSRFGPRQPVTDSCSSRRRKQHQSGTGSGSLGVASNAPPPRHVTRLRKITTDRPDHHGSRITEPEKTVFETCDAGRAGARPYRRKPASRGSTPHRFQLIFAG